MDKYVYSSKMYFAISSARRDSGANDRSWGLWGTYTKCPRGKPLSWVDDAGIADIGFELLILAVLIAAMAAAVFLAGKNRRLQMGGG